MFKKLRLKFTLINVAIILFLFLFLIIGVYCFASIDMARHGDILARKVMADLLNDPSQNNNPLDTLTETLNETRPTALLQPLPGPRLDVLPEPLTGPRLGPPLGHGFFFVKTTPSGIITFQSSGQPLDAIGLAALTERALRQDLQQGTIFLDQVEYFYLTAPLSNQPGTLVLFRDLSSEANMLQTILTALVGVGIICSLLSFGASFYMANRAMIPVQRAWQQQREFISDASHELRTPLTVFQINLDVIRSCPDETVSSQDKWLSNIEEVSISMAKLVHSLLFLARADSEQQLLNKQSFSFNDALDRTIAPFEAVADAKGITLQVLADNFVTGYGDEDRIKQVIGILLDNAIRHTPTGGKVLVFLSQADATTLLTVTDTGEGIEPEYLSHVFERFYQVDRSRNKGGSGLGLAIAKWIVENHDGKITAISAPGTGTTFTVSLPSSVD